MPDDLAAAYEKYRKDFIVANPVFREPTCREVFEAGHAAGWKACAERARRIVAGVMITSGAQSVVTLHEQVDAELIRALLAETGEGK
jgi:hypothetical protein